MPVNQAVVAGLAAGKVPPEDQCFLPQETLDAIVRNLQIVGLASQIASGTGVTPITNNLAQQAFNLATQNTQDISTLGAKTIQRRVVVTRTNIPVGNSVQAYIITPPMPSQDYFVLVEYNGPETHPANHYDWAVINGTKTESGFQIRFDDSPASATVTIIVEESRNIE